MGKINEDYCFWIRLKNKLLLDIKLVTWSLLTTSVHVDHIRQAGEGQWVVYSILKLQYSWNSKLLHLSPEQEFEVKKFTNSFIFYRNVNFCEIFAIFIWAFPLKCLRGSKYVGCMIVQRTRFIWRWYIIANKCFPKVIAPVTRDSFDGQRWKNCAFCRVIEMSTRQNSVSVIYVASKLNGPMVLEPLIGGKNRWSCIFGWENGLNIWLWYKFSVYDASYHSQRISIMTATGNFGVGVPLFLYLSVTWLVHVHSQCINPLFLMIWFT